jgi:hypothetical protein
MTLLVRTIVRWVPIAVAVTGLALAVVLAVQTDLRLSGNDPQIQMAEDAAKALEDGTDIASVVPATTIDLRVSLAPFLVVFDDQGAPIAASAELDGRMTRLPAGVFEYVRQNGEDRVSWQPDPEVRIAAVVVQINSPGNGFVMAGRSLREVEARKSVVQSQVGAAWLAILATTLVATWLGEWSAARSRR